MVVLAARVGKLRGRRRTKLTSDVQVDRWKCGDNFARRQCDDKFFRDAADHDHCNAGCTAHGGRCYERATC